jgi:hypothetical protein
MDAEISLKEIVEGGHNKKAESQNCLILALCFSLDYGCQINVTPGPGLNVQ